MRWAPPPGKIAVIYKGPRSVTLETPQGTVELEPGETRMFDVPANTTWTFNVPDWEAQEEGNRRYDRGYAVEPDEF